VKEHDIRAFLKSFAGPNIKITIINGWVMVPCPLARWTHASGTDSHPSFGVSIKNEDKSSFHCFTCKKKGPLSRFVKLWEQFTGENHGKLIAQLERDEAYQAELPDWDDCRQLQNAERPEPLPDYLANLYDPLEGNHVYLQDRGITERGVERARLMIDPDDQGVERIVFPVYGLDGKCYGYTGRASSDKVQPKVRDYHGLQKRSLLLGLHTVTEEDKYVIVVEGLLDYLNLTQYGYAALAVMHSTLTDHQADILKNIGKPVYLMYDHDEAGRLGAKQAADKLVAYIPVMACDWDAADFGDADPPNDPAELYEEEIPLMLEGAQLL
jgi:DNA primase